MKFFICIVFYNEHSTCMDSSHQFSEVDHCNKPLHFTDEHNEAQGFLVTLIVTKIQCRVRLKQESPIQVLDSSHYLPATSPVTEMNILLLISVLEYTLESEEL